MDKKEEEEEVKDFAIKEMDIKCIHFWFNQEELQMNITND